MHTNSVTYSQNIGRTRYLYTFNGKEADQQTGWQDYGFRMYDPRISRFFTIDPLSKKYPELTPYQFASNTPIQAIDLDGLEKFTVTLTQVYEVGEAKIKVPNDVIAYKLTLSIVYDDGTPPMPIQTKEEIVIYERKVMQEGAKSANAFKNGHSYKGYWVKYNDYNLGIKIVKDETTGKKSPDPLFFHVGSSTIGQKGCKIFALADECDVDNNDMFSSKDQNMSSQGYSNSIQAAEMIKENYDSNKDILEENEVLEGKGNKEGNPENTPHPTPNQDVEFLHINVVK